MREVTTSRRFRSVIATAIVLLAAPAAYAADEPAKPTEATDAAKTDASAEKGSGDPAQGTGKSPIDLVNTVEKGKLKNPYTDNPDAIAEGKKFYLSNSCNGCHGGGGGGGMCPPLTNETWVYGSDDDTLFRLITLGSKELKEKQGFKAIAKEAVTGPMPPYKDIIKEEEKLWKIIAYVRSVYGGRPEKRTW